MPSRPPPPARSHRAELARTALCAPRSRADRPQRGGAGAALKWRRRGGAPPGLAMKLIIQETYERASEWAAKYIRNRIVHFAPGPGRFFTLGLPTGGWRRDRAGCEGLTDGGADGMACVRRQHAAGLLQKTGGVLQKRGPVLQVRENLQHGRVRR